MNNFQRHSWFTFGAVVGVAMSGFFGWPIAVGWLIGYCGTMWIVYAFLCGYLRVHRHPEASPHD